MWILCHFSIPIPNSSYYTTMGAIDAGSVWRSEAQLRPKRPHVEFTGPTASAVPSSFSPSSSTGDVTLKAIMMQLQRMDARLDTFIDELCQVNTCVGCIAWWQARLGGFAASPTPSPKASADEDGDDDEDEDEDASSSSDDEMTTFRWLTLCHSWQKEGIVLGWE